MALLGAEVGCHTVCSGGGAIRVTHGCVFVPSPAGPDRIIHICNGTPDRDHLTFDGAGRSINLESDN